jgi:hypothetical protein
MHEESLLSSFLNCGIEVRSHLAPVFFFVFRFALVESDVRVGLQSFLQNKTNGNHLDFFYGTVLARETVRDPT